MEIGGARGNKDFYGKGKDKHFFPASCYCPLWNLQDGPIEGRLPQRAGIVVKAKIEPL